MRQIGVVSLSLALLAGTVGAAPPDRAAYPDVVGTPNFLHGYPAINRDGTVNVVVECPAGTNDKWEVDRDGVLRLQWDGERPKQIKFLPFPVNYGIVVHSLVPADTGGEEEQLDIQVLGPAFERGTVLKVHVIGALALLDKGSQDDKLLGVAEGTLFADIRDIAELDQRFPGLSKVLESWWVTFKAPSMVSFGWVGRKPAMRLVDAASDVYDQRILPNLK